MFTYLIYFLLSGFILFSGTDKLFHLVQFSVSLSGYKYLPESIIIPLTVTIPIIEIFIGIFILIPAIRRMGLICNGILFFLFTIVMAINIYIIPVNDCGCWVSINAGRPNFMHLLLNLSVSLISFINLPPKGKITQKNERINNEKVH